MFWIFGPSMFPCLCFFFFQFEMPRTTNTFSSIFRRLRRLDILILVVSTSLSSSLLLSLPRPSNDSPSYWWRSDNILRRLHNDGFHMTAMCFRCGVIGEGCELISFQICTLQANVSYETGGRVGVSGTLWTIRACVCLPTTTPTSL